MKKIIPALCLLLVSAVVMATASFAWFSMNTEVTATGMQVTAKVPESISISVESADAGFSSTVKLESEVDLNDKMITASTYVKNGSTIEFFKLTDAAMAVVNEKGEMTDEVHKVAEVADNETYDATTEDYFKDQMWLKYDGETGSTKNIDVKVEWTEETTTQDGIKGAFHVAFVDVSGNVLLDYDMTDADTAKALGLTLTAGDPATLITAYGYLAGTDEQCFNSNIKADDKLSVTITYLVHADLVP